MQNGFELVYWLPSNIVTTSCVCRALTYTLQLHTLNLQTCKNNLDPQMTVDASGANVTLAFRNNTTLRMLELGQLLQDGIGYYHVQVIYPEFGITLDLMNLLMDPQTYLTGYILGPGPMMT